MCIYTVNLIVISKTEVLSAYNELLDKIVLYI